MRYPRLFENWSKKPVPALATAAQICVKEEYTSTTRSELAYRAKDVFSSLGELLRKVPRDGKVVPETERTGSTVDGLGSIQRTGTVWNACREVVKLTDGGVKGILIEKVKGWAGIIKDTMEELKEWGEDNEAEDEDDEDDDEDDDDEADDVNGSAQDDLDDLMNSSAKIPSQDREKILALLETSLKRIRLVGLFYQAFVKRRLQTLPPPKSLSSHSKAIDEAITNLKDLADKSEELVMAFYEVQVGEIGDCLEAMSNQAVETAEKVKLPWGGAESDEFTTWVEKFGDQIRKK